MEDTEIVLANVRGQGCYNSANMGKKIVEFIHRSERSFIFCPMKLSFIELDGLHHFFGKASELFKKQYKAVCVFSVMAPLEGTPWEHLLWQWNHRLSCNKKSWIEAVKPIKWQFGKRDHATYCHGEQCFERKYLWETMEEGYEIAETNITSHFWWCNGILWHTIWNKCDIHKTPFEESALMILSTLLSRISELGETDADSKFRMGYSRTD